VHTTAEEKVEMMAVLKADQMVDLTELRLVVQRVVKMAE
jgi:hypothetical protein